MASKEHKPSNIDAAGSDVKGDIRAYSAMLERIGGEQVKSMMRPGSERTVCAALYAAPPYDLRVPAMNVARLALNLTPARVTGGTEDERARDYDAQRYSLFLAPAGVEMRWRKQAASRHLMIYFDPHSLGGDDIGATLVQPRALHNVSVPGIRPLADQLAEELRHGESVHAVDCLARLLLIQVSRHLCKTRDNPRLLGARSMGCLKDYVMAHLSERILVADLAHQVGLSSDRFAWSFKLETGQSPHQFILAQRLEQARQLLQHSQRSIVDVAHACGFSSQQHLTNSMQRHLGTTPARCRKITKPK